ncbi:hypothetical protein CSAL01_03844 [Colletotrichum salicis]|uniref:Uncharacterized protein n=1 Tax=Colletotrichum salicis TaxID=1209931 RepID=A0A135UMQ6_9PEZI|nr:hypothetical protein CSAL01_03844 [Colletotrichum salicis]
MPSKNPASGIVVLGITLDGKEWAKSCLELILEELHADGFDTLSLAAKYRRAELCVSLIELGSDPKRLLPSNASALEQAILGTNMTSVKELLKHGDDPNIDTRIRPLCQAVHHNGSEMVQLLIENEALLDGICSNCSFTCALEPAAYQNNRDAAEMLIKAWPTVDLRLYGEYDTALMAAAYSGSLDVAKLLIKHGADVNIKLEPSRFGGVLGAAFCGYGVMKMIPYLIEKAGANPNRIIEDLRERDPWISDSNKGSAYEISEWLFAKSYLNPEEVRGLAYNAYWNVLEPLIQLASWLLKDSRRSVRP